MDLKNNLIEFLNYSGTLGDLEKKRVKVSRDFNYPGLYNLKYQSILVDKSDPLVCACRGAVVERVDNDGDHSPYYRLVAYAFDRFFNIGEGHCHQLDWSRTKVYEKFSGSLIKLFEYRGQWLVSTSGSVAGDGLVGKTKKTFDELFWDVFEKVGYLKECLDPSICYIFELCHLDNKDVINYNAPKLPLLAVRDRDQDFEECDLEEFGLRYGYDVTPSYEFSDLDSVLTKVEKRDSNHEGYVLFDGDGRAKIKSRLYCQLHKAWNNGEPDFSELFLNDDLDEFLLHFPEYREGFDAHLRSIDEMEAAVCEILGNYNHLNQKEFAQIVIAKERQLSGACFTVRSGKYATFQQWLADLRPQQLDKLLGIR